MTVSEYNKEFLPAITRAEALATGITRAIEHMEISDEAKENVAKHLRIHACWSPETEETIRKALEFYRVHAGIETLELDRQGGKENYE